MMKESVYISATTQYIIDQVRLIRHELGLSQRAVSRYINPDTTSNIVGNIETIKSSNGYSDHNLNILVKSFSEYAKKLLLEMDEPAIRNSNIKSEYTIYDFYPKKPLSDIPQIKTKVDLPEGISLTGTINAILETKDFLDQPRSIREITDYCNALSGKNWKSNNLTSTLDYALRKGKLRKIELPGGGVQYQRA